VDDFNHMWRLRLFLDLNGDLLPRHRRRDFEDMLAKLRQIKRGRWRHLVPVARRRRFAGYLQGIHFPGHAMLAASRVPEFYRGEWQ
jgi:hypothetical protein